MKKVFSVMLALTVGIMFCFAGAGLALEKATKDECVAKAKAAAELARKSGLDAALEKIGDKNGPFVWKDSYVFCIDLKQATVLAHPIKPKLRGKKLIGIKDSNGKMFFVEMVNTAKNQGQGWVSYMWPRPGEKKPSAKVTYIYRIPGVDAAMCAGVYE
ncbi:MAG: cache domain-containing protein [Deltaproteobacteria bacterium]|nr:cache domain-containing protein [Deltaproteobacteria bacterium]MBW1923668.1 cache domain-containing protein [Deltaproteobacteria bacterium]MBW1950182.1 cache domain-containing protein [Deltaproteobacteria bacterium]MBW2009317.1 cache domain-containing protein [Deltaproteobacteria bacterium]MBW2103339.1 cache domain-containing protein [Deltaproteobacteria bacterium]